MQGYGGLRGAVSFSLAFALDDGIGTSYQHNIRGMFLAATYCVILFTVFFQVNPQFYVRKWV